MYSSYYVAKASQGDSESYDWSGRSSQTMRVEASRTDGPSGEHSEDESAMPSLHNPFDDETTGDDASGNRISEPLWLCSECMSPDWRIMPGGYRCGRCGCMSFFDARTERPPAAPVQNHADKPDEKPAGRHTRKPDDPEPSSSDMPDERAESEPRTSDPSIDPETLKPLSRRQRRAARKSAGNIDRRAQSNVATTSLNQKQLMNMPTQTSQGMTSRHSGHSDWRDEMLKGLNSAVNRDKDKEWSLRKGPSPGIKYRGGSPPNPPQWSYHRDDLRAFQKWERKIEVWTIQVSAYLPPNEAAMLLYVSLKGEAEEELEWCDIKKINADDGVQYIVNTLRQPLMTRSVYLKRKYLHEYEYVQRQSNEPIRSFCNRYGRIERSLKSVNINVEGMYDGESRGARLLERMRLGLEQQRLILVASNQSLEFDTIREAAQIQFPDHRPTPQVVFNREFDGEKRQDSTSQRTTTPQPQHRPQKGHGKGGKSQSKGKSQMSSLPKSTAYVTEIADSNDQAEEEEDSYHEEQHEEEDGAEGEELNTIEEGDEDDGDQEGDLVADLAEVARCLTVTARRLQGMTLGRKFTGGSKTIAQRKAETHCAVCGQKGHWQGDSECPQSGNSNGGKGGKTFTPGNKKPEAKSQAKKVMTVTYGSGRREIPIQDTPEEIYGTRFQTFMIRANIPNKVLANSISSFKEYMVLDTACQRTCCSTRWFQEWSKLTKQYGMHAKKSQSQEPFEFGHGPTQYSHMHAYLPANFDHNNSTPCLSGAQVINATNDIPLLGSCDLMKKMQTIIDMPNQEVRFQALGVTVPLEVVNGHVAVKITRFSDSTDTKRKVWQDLFTLAQHEDADPEFITAIRHSSISTSSSERSRDAKPTTSMDSSMAPFCDRVLQRGVLPGKSDDPSLQASFEAKDLGCIPGPNVDGGERAADCKSNRTVSTRSAQEIRQQTRPIQQMPQLRQKLGVERGARPMGAASKTKKQAATALTILFNSGGVCGQPLYTSSFDGSEPHLNYIHGFDSFNRSEDSTTSWRQSQEHGQEDQQIPCLRGRDVGDLRVGSGGCITPEGMNSFFLDKTYAIKYPEDSEYLNVPEDAETFEEIFLTDYVKGEPTSFKTSENVKNGNKAWLAGHLKTQRKIYEN